MNMVPRTPLMNSKLKKILRKSEKNCNIDSRPVYSRMKFQEEMTSLFDVW